MGFGEELGEGCGNAFKPLQRSFKWWVAVSEKKREIVVVIDSKCPSVIKVDANMPVKIVKRRRPET